MKKRATRTIDPLDGPVDFSRFGSVRRNAFAGAGEPGGPSTPGAVGNAADGRARHQGLARVRCEAQAMAHLGDHPNVVTMHDVGDDNGQPFIISQYMAGGAVDAPAGALQFGTNIRPTGIGAGRRFAA
jgi:serine/threonine protein kinase